MSERTYIEYDNARIVRLDGLALRVEMYDGRVFDGVEARRLFPVTGASRYITLLDEDGAEQAVIRNLKNLEPDSRKAVEETLAESYLVPKITKVLACTEKYGKLTLKVETDIGEHRFEIKNVNTDIKVLFDGRVFITDSSDNRYEIPGLRKLDKKSLALLSSYL